MSNVLTTRLKQTFAARFKQSPALLVRAPGRVNLIGEHTDYNGGFVLPCAINLETQVAVSPRADRLVRVLAADYGDVVDEFELSHAIGPSPSQEWANYVRGVFKVLQDRDYLFGGVDMAVAGDIPRGAGLSSSASLSVAVALSLQHVWQLSGLDAVELARVAQISESDFVGCQCGIMDQLTSTSGQAGHVVLIDCDQLTTQAVPVPADMAVMIVHSGISRGLVDGEYNTRRAQCEQAAAQLGVAQLRDADMSLLHAHSSILEDVVYRRARHVITENQRTLDAADCLAQGDLAGLGKLMAASHTSMRDDFEITVPGVDQLVEVLQAAIGPMGGARMTGGGFGGAVVALLPATAVAEVTQVVRQKYQTPAGQAPEVMIERPVAGAGLVT
ncbi:MAG: galactokinase [Pseudomonadota bacterium]